MQINTEYCYRNAYKCTNLLQGCSPYGPSSLHTIVRGQQDLASRNPTGSTFSQSGATELIDVHLKSTLGIITQRQVF